MNTLDRVSLGLVIVGAINWLLVGLFRYDLVASIFGGTATTSARIVYTLVGIAGLYSLSLFARNTERA